MAARSARRSLRSSTRRKRPRSWRRSRVRRFRLIPRTSRRPRVVQEVRVGNAPRDRKSRSHAGFRASRWRDPDSNRGHHDFQSCGPALEIRPDLQGILAVSAASRASAIFPHFAPVSRAIRPTARSVGLFAALDHLDRGSRVPRLACPSWCWMTIEGTPSRAISTAWAWRNRCGAKRRRTPAAAAAEHPAGRRRLLDRSRDVPDSLPAGSAVSSTASASVKSCGPVSSYGSPT